MRGASRRSLVLLAVLLGLAASSTVSFAQEEESPAPAEDATEENELTSGGIIHDAEYYIVEAQMRDQWAGEDAKVDSILERTREENAGRPVNIIHFMWDDQPFGAVGMPAMQQIRGFETPNLNKQAADGIIFSRMYTEPSCTPTRSAALTGQLARRTGIYEVGFGIEYHGFPEDTTTIGEVMSKAGYKTGFFGKAHVGDMETSYLHKGPHNGNKGFDEAFVAVYNQVSSVWNKDEEVQNKVIGIAPEVLAPNPYEMDKTFVPGWDNRWVFFYEGNATDGATYEWCGTSRSCYDAFDPEAKERAFAFIRSAVAADEPFFVMWWPNFLDIGSEMNTTATKASLQRGMTGEGYTRFLDPAFGELMDLLEELQVANNTLVVSMSDNGPMTHGAVPGMGMGEGIFRGGKGDFLEGGVRVSAQASWPSVIEPGQSIHDIIHVTDLFTTFARLGGALDHIPRDRVIDGIDQSALLLLGDTHGRRDHVFIYIGPQLAATVKGHIKMHWRSADPLQAASGITAVYDLYNDPRETAPMVVEGLHFKEPFKRMRARHELWVEKYPHAETNRGPAFTSIANARPETEELTSQTTGGVDFDDLPFDVTAYMTYDLPFDPNAGREGMR